VEPGHDKTRYSYVIVAFQNFRPHTDIKFEFAGDLQVETVRLLKGVGYFIDAVEVTQYLVLATKTFRVIVAILAIDLIGRRSRLLTRKLCNLLNNGTIIAEVGHDFHGF
jgi:hypothetical protein